MPEDLLGVERPKQRVEPCPLPAAGDEGCEPGDRPRGEEGLARCEVALWLEAESLTVEYAEEILARYEVQYDSGSCELREVTRPTLFETSHAPLQTKLFDLVEALGEDG